MQAHEIMGAHWETGAGYTVHPANGQFFLYYAFKDWWTMLIYGIGFVALWFHMTHGFWSAFQSIGTNNNKWMCRLKTTSYIWATAVCGLFMAEAIVFTVRANDPAYEQQLIEHAIEVDRFHRYHDAQHGVPASQGGCIDFAIEVESTCSGHKH